MDLAEQIVGVLREELRKAFPAVLFPHDAEQLEPFRRVSLTFLVIINNLTVPLGSLVVRDGEISVVAIGGKGVESKNIPLTDAAFLERLISFLAESWTLGEGREYKSALFIRSLREALKVNV